jgi:hypothetical protein
MPRDLKVVFGGERRWRGGGEEGGLFDFVSILQFRVFKMF